METTLLAPALAGLAARKVASSASSVLSLIDSSRSRGTTRSAMPSYGSRATA
jgi:hypothetical protein